MRVSVVTPTFNRAPSLRRFLTALTQQTFPAADFEVVVVDDGSTDVTASMLADLETPFALRVLHQANQGPGAARNLGVEHARGEIVVFLDDDVVPVADLLARHVAAHSGNTVVIGPMSPPPDDFARPAWVRWEEDMLQVQYRALAAGDYPCTPRQFYTANASVPRALFVEAGGFDATYKRAEDIELAFSFREMGARFVFEPQAEILHYAERSFASWRRTPYQYGKYDVVMHRTRRHDTLHHAMWAFHRRHPLNRALARLCVGRPRLLEATVAAFRGVVAVSDRLNAYRPAAFALSAMFNLLYWQGVCDEIGTPDLLWRSVAARLAVV
jgi:glycosyltransferase involved in cell wall biosynthesis